MDSIIYLFIFPLYKLASYVLGEILITHSSEENMLKHLTVRLISLLIDNLVTITKYLKIHRMLRFHLHKLIFQKHDFILFFSETAFASVDDLPHCFTPTNS